MFNLKKIQEDFKGKIDETYRGPWGIVEIIKICFYVDFCCYTENNQFFTILAIVSVILQVILNNKQLNSKRKVLTFKYKISEIIFEEKSICDGFE